MRALTLLIKLHKRELKMYKTRSLNIGLMIILRLFFDLDKDKSKQKKNHKNICLHWVYRYHNGYQ
jgi:hypothetical protein